jgi:predicted esterase
MDAVYDLPSSAGALMTRVDNPALYCVVFHGQAMESIAMKEWVEGAIASFFPRVEFIYLQAPLLPDSAGNDVQPNWLQYTKEFDGEKEDEVCLRTLAAFVDALLDVIGVYVNGDLENTVLLGLSQGGCIALELALHARFRAVVTLVSHRLHCHSRMLLRQPWFALTAKQDDIFPSSWAWQTLVGP